MTRRSAAWLTLLLLLPACYDRPAALDAPLEGLASFALGPRLLFLRQSPAEAVLLDFAKPTPTRSAWPFDCDLGPSARLEGDRLALVCWGDASELRVLGFDADGAPTWTTYPLPSAYTSLVASDDGRYVVGFFGPGASSGHLFQNASEVAVVDTAAEPSEANPAARVLDLRDRDPLAVRIGPELSDQGTARRLVVVEAPSLLAVFDLMQPGDDAQVVPLVPSGTLQQVTPNRLRFFTDRPDGRLELFVGATPGTDIYDVLFTADPAGVGTVTPDLDASIRLLTLPAAPVDFQPFVDAKGQVRVAALSTATEDLVLFAPDQGLQRVNRMPYRFTALNAIARGDGQPHFLLSAPGDWQMGRLLADFDVAEADAKSADTFTLVELGDVATAVLPVEGSSTFLVQHGTGALTLLDGRTHARSLVKELGSIRDARLVGSTFHVLTDVGDGSAYGRLDVLHHQSVTVDVPGETSQFLGVGDDVTLFDLWSDEGGAVLGVRQGSDGAEVLEWRGFLLDGSL